MRLLFLTQYFPPERGPVRDVYNLALAMSRRGHSVSVVAGLPNYPGGKPYPGFGRFLPDIRIENEVKVIRVPLIMASNSSPLLRIIGILSFALSALPWLLLLSKPDLIIATIPPVTSGPIALFISLLRNIPMVLHMQDVEPLRTFQMRKLSNKRYARLLSRFFISIYKNAEKIVVPIEDEMSLLLEYGIPPDKIKLITHNIDIDGFYKKADGIQVPFRIPRKDNRFIALYMGTIGIAHDHESLITAFGSEEIKKLPIDLVIIGDGECASSCRKRIKDMNLVNTFIYPPVSLDWVPNILLQADLLVCTLGPEPFSRGSKFYEYLAAAKPILANSGGILAKTINEIGNGWAVNARENESLAKALGSFIALTQNEREEIGMHGLEYAKKFYNAADAHNSWEKFFEEIIIRL